MESFCESVMGSWSVSSEASTGIHCSGAHDVKVINNNAGLSVCTANGNVSLSNKYTLH